MDRQGHICSDISSNISFSPIQGPISSWHSTGSSRCVQDFFCWRQQWSGRRRHCQGYIAVSATSNVRSYVEWLIGVGPVHRLWTLFQFSDSSQSKSRPKRIFYLRASATRAVARSRHVKQGIRANTLRGQSGNLPTKSRIPCPTWHALPVCYLWKSALLYWVIVQSFIFLPTIEYSNLLRTNLRRWYYWKAIVHWLDAL